MLDGFFTDGIWNKTPESTRSFCSGPNRFNELHFVIYVRKTGWQRTVAVMREVNTNSNVHVRITLHVKIERERERKGRINQMIHRSGKGRKGGVKSE